MRNRKTYTYRPPIVQPKVELVGKTFGRLTVLSLLGKRLETSQKNMYYRVRCSCGTEPFDIINSALSSGKTQSCGCLHKEKASSATRTHGRSTHRCYNIHQLILHRCYSPNSPARHLYGDRGIKVCERWHSFENFYLDMGEPPSDDHSLDRIDNNKGYSPDNCRWATHKEQSRNTCRTIRLTVAGQEKALSDWAEELGIKPNSIKYFLKKGLGHAEALAKAGRKPLPSHLLDRNDSPVKIS